MREITIVCDTEEEVDKIQADTFHMAHLVLLRTDAGLLVKRSRWEHIKVGDVLPGTTPLDAEVYELPDDVRKSVDGLKNIPKLTDVEYTVVENENGSFGIRAMTNCCACCGVPVVAKDGDLVGEPKQILVAACPYCTESVNAARNPPANPNAN